MSNSVEEAIFKKLREGRKNESRYTKVYLDGFKDMLEYLKSVGTKFSVVVHTGYTMWSKLESGTYDELVKVLQPYKNVKNISYISDHPETIEFKYKKRFDKPDEYDGTKSESRRISIQVEDYKKDMSLKNESNTTDVKSSAVSVAPEEARDEVINTFSYGWKGTPYDINNSHQDEESDLMNSYGIYHEEDIWDLSDDDVISLYHKLEDLSEESDDDDYLSDDYDEEDD